MRFRARIEHDKFGRFFELIKCLTESGGKNAVVHLAEDQCRFVVSTEEESLLQYLTVASALSFSEVRIESRNNNVISLEVGIPNLVHALKAGLTSHFVTLKLTKKGASPYLTVDAQVAEGACNVVQDVPVRVLNAAEALRYQDPKLPEPMARLAVPTPRSVLAVTDRMRSLGAKAVRCDAHGGTGELVLSASSDCVALKATFRGLTVDDDPPGGVGADGEEPVHADVHVSIRDFSRALKAVSAVPLKLLMCVNPTSALLLHGAALDGYASVTCIMSLLDNAGAAAPLGTAAV